MAKAIEMTPEQIRRTGLRALEQALGPVGVIRFLRQFDPGEGDYTEERHQWLDHLTVDDIWQSIQRRREQQTEDSHAAQPSSER